MTRSTFGQFACFGGVGGVSAIGHYGLLIFLVQCFGVDPLVASMAGALLGAWVNYSLNYRLTFRSTKCHSEAALKFAVIAAVGLMLNMLFMWIGLALMNFHYLLGQIVTTGLVLIWSFLGNRYWTFHVKPEAN